MLVFLLFSPFLSGLFFFSSSYLGSGTWQVPPSVAVRMSGQSMRAGEIRVGTQCKREQTSHCECASV